MSAAEDHSQALPAIRRPEIRSELSQRQWLIVASFPLAGLLFIIGSHSLGAWSSRDDSSQQLSRLLSQSPLPAAVSVQAPALPTATEVSAAPAASMPPSPQTPAAPSPAALAVEEAAEDHARPAAAPAQAEPLRWAPSRLAAERAPSDHPPVPSHQPVEVRVVTIRARVTAYTPYDHAQTHPQWADGIVAWHPGGRQRRVANHRYGLATDWAQFPPGATFIRVPGYMERTFSQFPKNFRVVDDACGASRRARRLGLQPVIDVRFMTRYSAIDPRGGWGSRQLNVEVIYPADFRIPADLRRWVVADEWHTYTNGELSQRRPFRP